MITSIETTATIGPKRHLVLDEDIPAQVSARVRVIVFIGEELPDNEWLKSAAANDAFRFLEDDGENIYSVEDGKPIDDEA